MDSLLSQIFASFGSGSFTSSVSSALTTLLSEFIKNGASITPAQLTRYAQAVQKLVETTRPFIGRELGEERGVVYETREKRLRFVDAINKTLKLIDAVIKEIARTVYEPKSARQQVMSILGQRLLGSQIAQYEPAFGGPERIEAVGQVPEIELGGPPRGPLLEPDVYQPEPPFGEEEVYPNEDEFGPYQIAGQGRRKHHYKKY